MDCNSSSEKAPASLFGTFRRVYELAAVILLSVLVLFGLLNVVALILLKTGPSTSSGRYIEKHGLSALQTAYPGLNEREIEDLLQETWDRELGFEPFCQFREIPFAGRYINIDASGFRYSRDQAPWPPSATSINVFVFGGSTTFGYGASDRDTVPSHLQQALKRAYPRKSIAVYNFGRAFFYSSQERCLFERLLTLDHSMDVALFIDGLNDFGTRRIDEPYWTYQLQQLMPLEKKYLLWKLFQYLPLGKLILKNARAASHGPPRWDNQETLITRIIDRYKRNKVMIEAVAAKWNIEPVFVWQPVPYYKYDLDYHPFRHALPRHLAVAGYARMARHVSSNPLGNNFLWCADIQQNVHSSFYCDAVHYSSEFSKMLADHIVFLMKKQGVGHAFQDRQLVGQSEPGAMPSEGSQDR